MLNSSSPQIYHSLQNAALIALSLVTLPITLYTLLLANVLQLLVPQPVRLRRRARRSPGFKQRTVLVTGVGMSKGLHIARAFHLAGHTVIGADFEPYYVPVCGRWSKSLKKFYRLPKPSSSSGAAAYIQALLQIARKEKAELWVSCSSVGSAVEDAQAREVFGKRSDCVAIQFDVDTTAMLHEKHTFIRRAKELGLQVPETHEITSRAAVHKVLQTSTAGRGSQGLIDENDNKQYIMKAVGTNDKVRGDMTLLPRRTVSETYQHVAKLPISKGDSWVLQEFIQGDEYCTHALVVRGKVVVFVACPSKELLMHYEALPPNNPLSKAMLRFTSEFVRRSGDSMTGHLSFDFLVHERDTDRGTERTFYPIECNPRAHTAVVLFSGLEKETARAYMTALAPDAHTNGTITPLLTPETTPTRPTLARSPSTSSSFLRPLAPKTPFRYYWVGHDVVEFLALPLLSLLAFKISLRTFLQSVATFFQHLAFWKDGTFEIWDPLPLFMLYHVYWPGMFLVSLLRGERGRWSRCNVSTGKMFEC